MNQYRDISSKELIPLHKETFLKVIDTRIGNYYYSKIMGGAPDINKLLYKEKGRWYCHGLLYPISHLIEFLKNKLGKQFLIQEGNLIKKLAHIDKQKGTDVGEKILESLASFVKNRAYYEAKKKEAQEKIKAAKSKVSRLKKALETFKGKFVQSGEFDESQIKELGGICKQLEFIITRSKSQVLMMQYFTYYYTNSIPGMPQPMLGKKGYFRNKFPKENTLLEESTVELFMLLDPQRLDKRFYKTAKTIEYLLLKVGIQQSADNLRKTIQKRLIL